MMKKMIAVMLCLCLLLSAATALAGNVTIALNGQDDFDDYISSMMIYGDKLLMSSYGSLYTWSLEDRTLIKAEGYDELDVQLPDAVAQAGIAEEDEISTCYFIFSDLYMIDGQLYRAAELSLEDGTSSCVMVEVVIAEDGTMSLGEAIDLDDAFKVEYSDGEETYYYYQSLEMPCSFGRTLYGMCWGEELELLKVDIDTGDVETMTLDVEENIDNISPYTEGKLLMVASNYNVDPMEVHLYLYDTETEEATDLGQLPSDNYDEPVAVTYDAARGKIYYVLSGSVWRMDISEDGLGEAEEFGDMPLQVYSNSNGVVYGDLYVLSGSDGVVARDVTLDKLPEQKLRIINSQYAESVRTAYYAFTENHPEYLVAMGNSLDESALLQSMMNRDSTVDIYTINGSSGVLSTLIERGYVAELDSSTLLTEAVGSTYEYLQDFCTKDGHLYAIPLSAYAQMWQINKTCLTEKLGYTEEDIPTDWIGLFALLSDIADNRKLEDAPEVAIGDPYYTADAFRYQIFQYMMTNYSVWLDQSEENVSRGSEVLLTLCDAFNAVDWDNLGFSEEVDEEGMFDYNTDNMLLENFGFYLRGWLPEGYVNMPLALEVGGEALITENRDFAFVNPFSEHKEAAIEYLEHAWASVSDEDKMEMIPTMNEPVLNSSYEESLQNIESYLADMEKMLEEAEDEETRESIQNDIELEKAWLEEYRVTGKYDISPDAIAAYRELAVHKVVRTSNGWGDGVYDSMQQFLDGAMTSQQFVSTLEKTLQMKRLEGN